MKDFIFELIKILITNFWILFDIMPTRELRKKGGW